MTALSVIAFFCEDVREESSGQVSLIGVMPDNALVPVVPGFFGRLCIYTRMQFSPKKVPRAATLRVHMPDGQEFPMDAGIEDAFRAAAQGSKEHRSETTAVILTTKFPRLVVGKAGFIRVIAVVDGKRYVAGELNIVTPKSKEEADRSAAANPHIAASQIKVADGTATSS